MPDDWANWEDFDPETDSFTSANMLMPYEGEISAQFLRNLARNTSWLWRNGTRNRGLVNETFNSAQEKTYDTGKNYVGSYLFVWARWNSGVEGPITFPFKFDELDDIVPVILLLTTDYQNIDNAVVGSATTFTIKALSTGGFRIKGNISLPSEPFYLLMFFHELRIIAGS